MLHPKTGLIIDDPRRVVAGISSFVSSSSNLQDLLLQSCDFNHLNSCILQLCPALVLANKLLWFQDPHIDPFDALSTLTCPEYSVHTR